MVALLAVLAHRVHHGEHVGRIHVVRGSSSRLPLLREVVLVLHLQVRRGVVSLSHR